MRRWVVGLIGWLALSGPVQTSTAAESQALEKDIVATAVGAGSFKTLAAALQAADLVSTLQGPGPFTVFAPTDEAFAKLPAGTVEELLKTENRAKLVAILTYHVVPGKVLSGDVVKIPAAVTVNGQRVDVQVRDGKVSIDQAQVAQVDIECSNGVIHVIDQVVLPSFDTIPRVAEKAGTFATLLAAAKAAGLVDALSGDQPLTVFAPTDEAFAKLPAGTVEGLLRPENKAKLAAILKLHVVPGRAYSTDVLAKGEWKSLEGGLLRPAIIQGKPTINGAGIVATDIDAANGVIHVLDRVILPEAPSVKGASLPKSSATHHVTTSCPKSRATVHVVRRTRHR